MPKTVKLKMQLDITIITGHTVISGIFVLKTIRSLELSFPGPFVLWNIRSLEHSLPG